MKNFQMFVFILLQVFGLINLPPELRAQAPTPPSQHCPNVSVAFASSAAYAPLTATGAGAPRVCLPQCSTSVATCSTGQQTTITPTFSGTGLGVISNRIWSVEGDIAIAGPNNGTTVVIYSTLSNTSPLQFGKGRLRLTYTNTVGACACIGFVTLDVFKRVNPLPTTTVVGPNCVAVGEAVSYSLAPDFSRNVNVGISVDNNYRWTPPVGFAQQYAAGDNSSRVYNVSSSFTGGNIQAFPGSSTADPGQSVPGTGCNNLGTNLLAIGVRPANFVLNLTPSVTSPQQYFISGNGTSALTGCVSVGAASASLAVGNPQVGTTYTATSPSAAVPFTPTTPSATLTINPTLTGTGSINFTGTRPAPTCGSSSATLTFERKLPASTTLTRLSTNFGTPTGNVYCLRPGTYTFQLSGPVNLPASLITSSNTGLPTALGTWSWNNSSNVLTLVVTSSSGTGTTYPISLNGVTCSNGNITTAPDLYRLATPSTTSFTLGLDPSANPSGCGGNFQMLASAFANLSSCRAQIRYTWSVTPATVRFLNNNSNSYQGCGFNLAQLDVNTIPTTGCVVTCTVDLPTPACVGGCATCTTYTITGTTTQSFTVPSNTQAYLNPCRPGPGGGGDPSKLSVGKNFDFDFDPNPTYGALKVNLNKESAGKVVVTVLDSQGRVLLSTIQETSTFDLDCSKFEPGVYFLSVQSDTEQKVKQFIKK